MTRCISHFCLLKALIGKKYARKPALMNVMWEFVIPMNWLARLPNSLMAYPRSWVRR